MLVRSDVDLPICTPHLRRERRENHLHKNDPVKSPSLSRSSRFRISVGEDLLSQNPIPPASFGDTQEEEGGRVPGINAKFTITGSGIIKRKSPDAGSSLFVKRKITFT